MQLDFPKHKKKVKQNGSRKGSRKVSTPHTCFTCFHNVLNFSKLLHFQHFHIFKLFLTFPFSTVSFSNVFQTVSKCFKLFAFYCVPLASSTVLDRPRPFLDRGLGRPRPSSTVLDRSSTGASPPPPNLKQLKTFQKVAKVMNMLKKSGNV